MNNRTVKAVLKDFCVQYLDIFCNFMYPVMASDDVITKSVLDSYEIHTEQNQNLPPFLCIMSSIMAHLKLVKRLIMSDITDISCDLIGSFTPESDFVKRCVDKFRKNRKVDYGNLSMQHASIYINAFVKYNSYDTYYSNFIYSHSYSEKLYEIDGDLEDVSNNSICASLAHSTKERRDRDDNSNILEIQFMRRPEYCNQWYENLFNYESTNGNKMILDIGNIGEWIESVIRPIEIVHAGLMEFADVLATNDDFKPSDKFIEDGKDIKVFREIILGYIEEYFSNLPDTYVPQMFKDRLFEPEDKSINPFEIYNIRNHYEEKDNPLDNPATKSGPVIPQLGDNIKSTVVVVDDNNKKEIVNQLVSRLLGEEEESDNEKDNDGIIVLNDNQENSSKLEDYQCALEKIADILEGEFTYSIEDYAAFANIMEEYLKASVKERNASTYDSFSLIGDFSQIKIIFAVAMDNDDDTVFSIVEDDETGELKVVCIVGKNASDFIKKLTSMIKGDKYPKFIINNRRVNISFTFDRDVLNLNTPSYMAQMDVLQIFQSAFKLVYNRRKTFKENHKNIQVPSFGNILACFESVPLFRTNKQLKDTVELFENYCKDGDHFIQTLPTLNPFVKIDSDDVMYMEVFFPNNNYVLIYDGDMFIKDVTDDNSIFGFTDEISIVSKIGSIRIPIFDKGPKEKEKIVDDIRKVLKWLEFNNKGDTDDENIDQPISKHRRKSKRVARKS